MNFQLDSPIFLKDFLKYKNAKFLVPYNTNYKIEKIVLDSRTYSGRGGIFFAIVGKKHDGHRFINEIIDRIDFIVISNKNFLCKEHKDKFIITDNTTLALNFLAHLYRSKFNKLKVIVVCGSNGKTTTKELIKKLLEEKYNVVASKGNQNNLIGLSYTLFSIKKNTDYCIAELGISLPGEMDYLAKTVQPDCIVITNIGKEHLEFLKNTKNVFKEETKVIKYLKPNGIIVLNKDDIFLKKLTNKNIKWYAIHDKTAEVLLKDIRYSRTYTQAKIKIEDETLNIKTRLLGEYNVYNILAAITVANYFTKMKKKTIRYALKNFKPVEMRGQKFKLYNSIVIDETYNANPDSMKSSISEFLKIFRKDKKIIVLSDMLELGKSSIKEHENLKNYIPLEKIEYLFLIGEKIYFLYKTLQKNKKIFYYKNLNNKVLRKITEIAKKNSFVMLFKGSHGSNLWQLVEKLKHIGGK